MLKELDKSPTFCSVCIRCGPVGRIGHRRPAHCFRLSTTPIGPTKWATSQTWDQPLSRRRMARSAEALKRRADEFKSTSTRKQLWQIIGAFIRALRDAAVWFPDRGEAATADSVRAKILLLKRAADMADVFTGLLEPRSRTSQNTGVFRSLFSMYAWASSRGALDGNGDPDNHVHGKDADGTGGDSR